MSPNYGKVFLLSFLSSTARFHTLPTVPGYGLETRTAAELRLALTITLILFTVLTLGSMQMSMRKLNSHTILQLWCCCHVMYKLLYPSIRVRTAPLVSVRVRVRVSVIIARQHTAADARY